MAKFNYSVLWLISYEDDYGDDFSNFCDDLKSEFNTKLDKLEMDECELAVFHSAPVGHLPQREGQMGVLLMCAMSVPTDIETVIGRLLRLSVGFDLILGASYGFMEKEDADKKFNELRPWTSPILRFRRH